MMGRRCDCEGLLDMLVRDPRLRGLPLAARALWMELVLAMRAAGGAALRFGSVVPDAREVALLVASSESELEANLQPILARGLLVREADGALASPLLAAAVDRSEINRANGLKGGAVRRRQAQERRQRDLPLMGVIQGGANDDTERESKPEANAAGPGSLAIAKLDKAEAKLAVDDATFHRVGRAAMEAAQFDDARSMSHYGIVRQWLADGFDEGVILDTIRAKTGPRVKSLGYFTAAIGEAMRRPADPAALPARSRALDRAVSEWFAAGMVGALPQVADFLPGGSRAHEVAAA